MSKKNLSPARDRATRARERLRHRYRPSQVRLLFVGESPPASGRFFYQRDSGLYRAVRDAFISAFPELREADFLSAFRDLGCYLVDLCAEPVDRLGRKQRGEACEAGEVRLGRLLKQVRPEIVVVLLRSITSNVKSAQRRANWAGLNLELPYPGRWKHHRIAFERELVPFLRGSLACR